SRTVVAGAAAAEAAAADHGGGRSRRRRCSLGSRPRPRRLRGRARLGGEPAAGGAGGRLASLLKPSRTLLFDPPRKPLPVSPGPTSGGAGGAVRRGRMSRLT